MNARDDGAVWRQHYVLNTKSVLRIWFDSGSLVVAIHHFVIPNVQ